MIEVAYDKRIGDETRPLKGNYFCCCLKGSLLTFFSTEAKNIFKWYRALRNKWDFSLSPLPLIFF